MFYMHPCYYMILYVMTYNDISESRLLAKSFEVASHVEEQLKLKPGLSYVF